MNNKYRVEPYCDSFRVTDGPGSGEALATLALREPPEWLHDCVERIQDTLALTDNWNSYGSSAVNAKSARLALELVVGMSRIVGIGKPVVTVSPDGNLAFCWENQSVSLDVEVFPDGMFEYGFTAGEREEEGRCGACVAIDELARLAQTNIG